MFKLLFICGDLPYDDVDHAGGKTVNHYIKEFAKKTDCKIHMIAICKDSLVKCANLEKYGIITSLIPYSINCFYKIINYIDRINAIFKFGNYKLFRVNHMILIELKDKLNCLKKQGYIPDAIIMEWTSITLLAPEIRSIYPHCKIVASEHDVAFQGRYREMCYSKNIIRKFYLKKIYLREKEEELDSLKKCDLICPHNKKDELLLIENGVEREYIFPIIPMYDTFLELKRNVITNDIIFYGAMWRKENYLSALWFIDNVLPKLNNKCRFIIIGSKPVDEIKKRCNEHIIVTGFVSRQSLEKYFSTCLCAVAPLVLGAGIKVKILEQLSAGIPVLTNKIGIEGIPAVNKESYFHCETVEEYCETIEILMKMSEGEKNELSKKAKNFIINNFDLKAGVDAYYQKLKNICNKAED